MNVRPARTWGAVKAERSAWDGLGGLWMLNVQPGRACVPWRLDVQPSRAWGCLGMSWRLNVQLGSWEGLGGPGS